MSISKEIKKVIKLSKNIFRRKYNKVLDKFQKQVKQDSSPFNKNIDFNNLILEIAENIFKDKKTVLCKTQIDFSCPKILILNTQIYDSGGHTEVALRFIKEFKDDFLIDFYITSLSELTENTAPIKSKIIKDMANEFYHPIFHDYDKKIFDLYNRIIENKYTTIFVNIHMYDVVGCAVLGLLKKHTNINIIYFNHADHFYCLGTDFADVIITRLKNNKPVTPYLENKKNVHQALFLENNEVNHYSAKEIMDLKARLNIPQNAFITISGSSFYKFGDEYFELIKKILDNNENVYHIFVCDVKKTGFDKMHKIINHHPRFIQTNFVPNFDLYIQTSDLFIDSFPQGSALTLIDCIKHSKPVVVKINTSDKTKSFEMYLADDYEYSCTTSNDMYQKACELINDKAKYAKTAKEVRSFYEKTYDVNKVKQKYWELIK